MDSRIVFAEDLPSSTLHGREARGDLVRLARGTRPTRRRGPLPSATLSRAELADWIDHLCAVDGAKRLGNYRDAAEGIAKTLGVEPRRVEMLNEIVGAALGTRKSTSGSEAMHLLDPIVKDPAS